MRVALICPYDMGRHGGVQSQVRLMAAALGDIGMDAWVVGPGEWDGPFFSLGRARTWSGNDSAAPIKLSPTLVPRLRRAVASADVVHVHEPLMPLVSIAARWVAKPLIGTFHADPSAAIRTIYERMPPVRWHLRAFRVLAAVSETARSALGRFGEVLLIPNGVATEGLPVPDPVAGRVIFVGRDDPRKGLDVARQAIRMIRKERPAAHLVVVTPDEVAAEPGVEPHVGATDSEKSGLLASAAVFVAPNRRGESFGLTVAEAMAAGVAPVVSDLPAFAAVAGDAALRVAPDDPAALARAVSTLLADDEARSRLATAARARADEFSIERTVAAYVPLYESVAG